MFQLSNYSFSRSHLNDKVDGFLNSVPPKLTRLPVFCGGGCAAAYSVDGLLGVAGSLRPVPESLGWSPCRWAWWLWRGAWWPRGAEGEWRLGWLLKRKCLFLITKSTQDFCDREYRNLKSRE